MGRDGASLARDEAATPTDGAEAAGARVTDAQRAVLVVPAGQGRRRPGRPRSVAGPSPIDRFLLADLEKNGLAPAGRPTGAP